MKKILINVLKHTMNDKKGKKHKNSEEDEQKSNDTFGCYSIEQVLSFVDETYAKCNNIWIWRVVNAWICTFYVQCDTSYCVLNADIQHRMKQTNESNFTCLRISFNIPFERNFEHFFLLLYRFSQFGIE